MTATSATKKSVLVVLGTRPEAVKLAPVINRLRARADVETHVLTTSQHRDLVTPILDFFSITPDFDLDLMRPGQTPTEIAAAVLLALDPILDSVRPDWTIVQGDTTSAMAAAMAAFHRKIPVAHVEAGLRTNDRYSPFPEEMNRRLITRLATLHLAATAGNRTALLAEGVADAEIIITGNPVIDALHEIIERPIDEDSKTTGLVEWLRSQGRRIVLLTTHRRENFGEPQREIFEAINTLVEAHDDIEIIYPIHPNPSVVEAAERHLRHDPRVHRLPPIGYLEFVRVMNAAHLILTDSGGIQEEAPALGRPVLVLRRDTERPETIDAGSGLLVGTERNAIVEAATRLLTDDDVYARMARPAYPFGEGNAAEKIVGVILNYEF